MVEAVVRVDASFGLFLEFEVTGWWCRCHSNKNKYLLQTMPDVPFGPVFSSLPTLTLMFALKT